ncbi:MAG: hypothetical protein ACRDIV_16240 [Ktedonobacteraceae bacterium]
MRVGVKLVKDEFGKDKSVDVLVSDNLITLLCSPEKFGSIQEISNDAIFMQRSKEAGEALIHLYNTQMKRRKEINEQLHDRLLDPITDSRYLLNISDVLKQIRHTPEQCYYLAKQLLKKLPQETLDCVFDTVWEISRRMGYRIFQDGEDIKVVEIDNIEAFTNEYADKSVSNPM